MRLILFLSLLNLSLVIGGCAEPKPELNRFEESPALAKEKTKECLKRLEHAIVDANEDMVNKIADDANCKAASTAHAEDVNSGEIAPVSPEQDDHSHHHH